MKITTEQKDIKNYKTEKWENILKSGRKKFVLKYGVLGWGIISAILTSVIVPLMSYFITSPEANFFKYFFSLDTALIAGLAFLLFPVSGYFWARGVWKQLTKQIHINN